MANKEVVCDGAKLTCSMGIAPMSLSLSVTSNSSVMVENKKVATELDLAAVTGTMCKSTSHPVYISTSAAGAPVTVNPCKPSIVKWDKPSKAVKISMMGLAALNKGSKCKCLFANGSITVGMPGSMKTKIN
jgi:hypothetical protein